MLPIASLVTPARLIHQRRIDNSLRGGRGGRLLGEPRLGPADVSGVAGCAAVAFAGAKAIHSLRDNHGHGQLDVPRIDHANPGPLEVGIVPRHDCHAMHQRRGRNQRVPLDMRIRDMQQRGGSKSISAAPGMASMSTMLAGAPVSFW